jgi:tetratricopeptide (TPR) repeat protein
MQRSAKKGEETKPKYGLYIHIAILCLVIIGLYSSITEHNYVDLDDTTVVVNNYPFLKNFSNAPQAFKQGVFQEYGKIDTLKTYYRPMMTISFMVDAHLSPATDTNNISPKPFFRGNIFYHIIACILLLLLLEALGISPTVSFLLTLLFAVHPLLTQAVAWIPGRNDPLVTIFVLSSLLTLLKYLDTRKVGNLILNFFFFMLALFTKENAIMLVGITFLYIYLVKGNTKLKDLIPFGIGYTLIAVCWFILRHKAIASSGPDIGLGEALKNILNNSPMFFQYIGKAVIPVNLSVMSTVQDTSYIQGIVAILLIGAGIYFSKQRNIRLIVFGFIWFFLFLTPSFITNFSGLEHRAYLPVIGFMIMASEFDMVKKMEFKFSPLNSGMVAMLAIVVIFIGITYSRLPIFKNCFAFDESAMKTSPKNVLPCLYLAKHDEETQNYNGAIEAYTEALRRDSNTPMIHNNIGGEYIAMNKYPEAEAELKKEVVLHPIDDLAIFNIGLIAYSLGQDSVALVNWKRALQIDPGFMNPHKMLAEYYIHKGDTVNAAPYIKWLKEKNYPVPNPTPTP